MSYQNTPSNDEDETAVLLGTTLTPPGFRWNQRVAAVAGMLMMLVVAGGAAVLLFETTDGGPTTTSAAESVVVATRDCLMDCVHDCLESGYGDLQNCEVRCEIKCTHHGECRNCVNSQPCCRDGKTFDFSCPGCRNGRI